MSREGVALLGGHDDGVHGVHPLLRLRLDLGATMTAAPRADLDGWRLIFADDFDTDVALGQFPAATPQWTAYPSPWSDTSKRGRYNPQGTVSDADSIRSVQVQQNVNGYWDVCAMTPVGCVGVYRRIEYRVRFRPDTTLAKFKLVCVWWPSPEPPSPNVQGEIDCGESNCETPHFNMFVHPKGGGTQYAASTPDLDTSVWHTVACEWEPEAIVGYIDGREFGRYHVNTAGIPDMAMRPVLQVETALGPAATNTPAPGTRGKIQFDYVSVWAWDPTAVAPIPLAAQLATATAARDSAVAALAVAAVDLGNMTAERDQLQMALTNATAERDQLQVDLANMTANAATLESSLAVVAAQRDILQPDATKWQQFIDLVRDEQR